MPHLTVEYSSNLEPHVDIRALVSAVHRAAVDTGAFDPAAIRTRAARRDVFIIGDGARRNAFVAIDVRMGPGQSEAMRQRIGHEIFSALEAFAAPACRDLDLRLSLELRESSAQRWRNGAPPGGGH